MDINRLTDAGSFPKVVLIDTISFCNLRCSMCGHKDMGRKRGRMDMELYRKIIDEIAVEDKNIRVWLVFFGEALLLKRTTLFPMIKYAKEKGLTDVVLNSNANLLDKEVAQGLIDSGLDSIYFGIDAFSPETYGKYRVGGTYETVVENVINLIELKKKLNVDNPKVVVQFVEMAGNKHEVEDFKGFWKAKGVVVKIRPMVSWAGLVECTTDSLPQKERWPCYWAMQTMSITDQGKVVLCAVDVDARFVAGDVTQDSLKTIWNDELKKIRKLHETGEFAKLPYPCKDCRDWQAAKAEFITQ